MTRAVAAIHKSFSSSGRPRRCWDALTFAYRSAAAGGTGSHSNTANSLVAFSLEFASPPSGNEPLQAEQDLASGDRTDGQAIVGSDRREPCFHPHVASHKGADGIGIEKIDHEGSVGNRSPARTGRRPANMAASSSSTSAALGCGGSWIARRTASGVPAWSSEMSEPSCSRANCWTLFRRAAAMHSRPRARSSGISMVRFVWPFPSSHCDARRP